MYCVQLRWVKSNVCLMWQMPSECLILKDKGTVRVWFHVPYYVASFRYLDSSYFLFSDTPVWFLDPEILHQRESERGCNKYNEQFCYLKNEWSDYMELQRPGSVIWGRSKGNTNPTPLFPLSVIWRHKNPRTGPHFCCKAHTFFALVCIL